MEKSPLYESRQAVNQDPKVPWFHSLTRYRAPTPIAFALVIVFFSFRFCSFTSNGTKVASLKGINLVTGTHLKTQISALSENPEAMDGIGKQVVKGERIPRNFWAIIAFLSAISGILIFYRKAKHEALTDTILSAIGFLGLLILRWVVKSKAEVWGGSGAMETDFLFSYRASLISFFIAGSLSYLQFMHEKAKNAYSEKNPSGVPGPTPIHINITTQITNPTEGQ